MRSLLPLLLSILAFAYLAFAWIQPEVLPTAVRAEVIGWRPSFEQIYTEWNRAHNAGENDQALAWADEFLMSVGGQGAYATDARAMRKRSLQLGGKGPELWEDRGLGWRAARVAERRPKAEWGILAAGLLMVLVSIQAFLQHRKKRRKINAPYEFGER